MKGVEQVEQYALRYKLNLNVHPKSQVQLVPVVLELHSVFKCSTITGNE